jgi:hypothetical protein
VAVTTDSSYQKALPAPEEGHCGSAGAAAAPGPTGDGGPGRGHGSPGAAVAAAALTGLLFVSLSINLQQILKQVWLPRRAGLTVMLLFETLVIAILGLVPGQPPVALGVELLGLGVGVWLFATGVYTVRRPDLADYRIAWT